MTLLPLPRHCDEGEQDGDDSYLVHCSFRLYLSLLLLYSVHASPSILNYVEFGTIKIRIHQPLPYSKELNGIAVAQPVREEEFTIFRLQHVCQADIVIFILLYDRYLRILYCYLCHIVCRIAYFALQSY